ncbi:MAG: phage integrase SAM-like domain-containing protein [Candidatus Pedobacter colombiensis]|uniref:Phage integrase SAM-like domain-containing protein n=1 Tax=Candidatus Pedobacter colombiensis TaxID=3121371 RepID=A0AAJ5WBK9_9SPHI|nr:site-specific integrase [Pedobacter sp.]WEK21305.1 MAG: phage integrase SAM-like domain-containing protein [Pedobacter sp.]
MKIKHEIELLPWVHKSKKRSHGKAPMFIRVTFGGCQTEVSLKSVIDPDNWDVKNKLASKQEEDFRKINEKIQSSKVDLIRIYDALWHQFDSVTPEMVKRVYQGKSAIEDKKTIVMPDKQHQTLLMVFDEFIARIAKKVQVKEASPGTLRHWKSTMKKVVAFLQHRHKKADIAFADIEPMFADEMYDYLTLDIEKCLSELTAKKQIKKIKQIIKLGVKKKLITHNPIADFVCGGDQLDIPPLELHEVISIYNKDFGIARLNEVRDCYVFQCFTGFAFQDIYDLSPCNIVLVGNKKERWLIKDRGKTGVSEMVPILPVIDQLIEKYKNHPKCRLRNALMPVDSNVRYNGYLKEIGVICNINRELNTHLARHTFADIILNLGVPLEDVSKMLGHKSVRTTQRYCRVRKQRISENMQIARQKLFNKKGQLKLAS